jgi:hypothetical protein
MQRYLIPGAVIAVVIASAILLDSGVKGQVPNPPGGEVVVKNRTYEPVPVVVTGVTKWQYKAEQQQMDDDVLKDYLNKQGKDQWELIAVEQMPVEPATPAVAGKPDPAKPRVMLFLRKPL